MTAARLRSAAARLREVAERATPGPWTMPPEDAPYVNWSTVVTDGQPGSRYIVCEDAGPDAAYIATMSPPVALALASTLTALADEYADWGDNIHRVPGVPEALAVADAVLGDRAQVPS